MSYSDAVAQDARLIILRELHNQPDGRLNEIGLRRVLDTFGIVRTRDWLVTQLHKLQELEAVTLTEVGSIYVAGLARAGRDHVDERFILAGVSKPSELD